MNAPPDYPAFIRAYKKRHKALQRRLETEQRKVQTLVLLLELGLNRIDDGQLKELIKHELSEMKR